LTREVRRVLPGGLGVRTQRSYEIRFVPAIDGYHVEGALVTVQVDVPPEFAALAELERRRPDEGMFPMRVDHHGRLVATGIPDDGGMVKAAVGNAFSRIERRRMSAEDEAFALKFLEGIEKQRAIVDWPQDLFMPVPGKRIERRKVPLPDGAQGDVAIELEATVTAVTGLLDSFRRTVTTSLGDSTRVVEEVWTLSEK
jgi:hypothetical protein